MKDRRSEVFKEERSMNNIIEEAVEKKRIEREEVELEPEEESEGSRRHQPWTKQITVRGVLVSTLIGAIYSVISMKLNLTTGLTPNFNVSAALLAFVFVRTWTKMVQKAGFVVKPFTQQENTMIQTCAVACYSLALGGGFGSYLLGLDRKTYEMSGVNTVGNPPNSVKDPGFGWMSGYLFLVCFVGLFMLVPLRKILIVDMKLTFPSGMATAVIINSFHNQGDQTAKKQVHGFFKYFSISFFWAFFQWFYTGKKGFCGFSQFPTFGLKALQHTFNFGFSPTLIGAGMIVPPLVTFSLLLGAVLSYGVMWPLIGKRKGDWFPASLDESSMESLHGYQTFLSTALILGDGIYYTIKVVSITIINLHGGLKKKNFNPVVQNQKFLDDKKQNEFFLRETIPLWLGITGYLVLSVVATIGVPIMFPQLKWYYVVLAYVLAPAVSFCNAYGAGLTDINMSFNYGQVALFALAALSGKENGLVAALVGGGLVKNVINLSCILMQDFKTAHLTFTSPRGMFLSQVIGTAIGCVIGPSSFLIFYKAFDVGNPNGEYKAPYGVIYRNLAIIGIQGFSVLPQHCLQLCYGFFAFAIAINLVRDFSPQKVRQWIPLPMLIGVPFLIGASFTIDMCLGCLIVLVWHKRNTLKAELMVPAIASGLICGDGLWSLPAAVLALAKIRPPLCMKFVTS